MASGCMDSLSEAIIIDIIHKVLSPFSPEFWNCVYFYIDFILEIPTLFSKSWIFFTKFWLKTQNECLKKIYTLLYLKGTAWSKALLSILLKTFSVFSNCYTQLSIMIFILHSKRNSTRFFSLFVMGSQDDRKRAPLAPTVTAVVLFSPRPFCATMAALWAVTNALHAAGTWCSSGGQKEKEKSSSFICKASRVNSEWWPG